MTKVTLRSSGRVERALAHELGLSRRVIIHWLRERRVAFEGARLRKADQVTAGQSLSLNLEGPLGRWILPATEPGELIAQGEGWVAIHKVSGEHSHIVMPFEMNTAVNRLVAHDSGVATAGDAPLEGGLVHRIDRGCSGCLIGATDPESWERLRLAFHEGRVIRRYLARVSDVDVAAGESRAPLRQVAPKRVEVSEEGRPCHTRWRPLGAGYLQVEIMSGHRHQIRVHLAHAGHPLIGDDRYGGVEAERLMLHCQRLEFPGGKVEVSAPF